MAQGHRCSECGATCRGNHDQSTLHLHVEIENLKQKLLERDSHIVTMETNFLTEADKFPNGECAALTEELLTWQEKYSRLYEAHKRIQKVNQNLEDKLLRIVDKCETEKFAMSREMTTMKQKMMDANATIDCLKDENERNRNDVNLAIQLLQCKPTNFVPQKFESLPVDLQHKVKLYMSSKKKSYDGSAVKHEAKTIKVPIPTYPPTAMFYSVNKSSGAEDVEEGKGKPVDIVSAAIVAKILEEREKERQNVRHCDSCSCRRQSRDTAVQTEESRRIGISGNSDIIRVESYQSPSPAVSSVTLIERSPVSLGNVISPTNRQHVSNSRRNDVTKLNVGRNRYHSSKLGREVKRMEKCDSDAASAKNSEIHIDDSGEVICDLSQLRASTDFSETLESERDRHVGPRRCSVSIQPGSSNILLDNATCYVPTLPRTNNPYALVHSSRSSSTSSTDERPTETQI